MDFMVRVTADIHDPVVNCRGTPRVSYSLDGNIPELGYRVPGRSGNGSIIPGPGGIIAVHCIRYSSCISNNHEQAQKNNAGEEHAVKQGRRTKFSRFRLEKKRGKKTSGFHLHHVLPDSKKSRREFPTPVRMDRMITHSIRITC
jgi:hypothetical protein